MTMKKMSKKKRVLIVAAGICLAGLLGVTGRKVISSMISSPPEDIYGEPVEVGESVYASPDMADELSDNEIQEFEDKAGEDSQIMIYEVGR